MTTTPNTWERLPSDTDRSFEAFCVYRDMGANRSHDKVAQQLSKSTALISRWSTAHDWLNRVTAFDEYQDSLRQERNLQRQKLIEDNAYSDYEFLRQAIEKSKQDYLAIQFSKVKPYDVQALVDLMKKADDYARRAVGLPDRITENKNEVTGKDGGAIETRTTSVNVNAESAHDAADILQQLADLGAIPSRGRKADNHPAPE